MQPCSVCEEKKCVDVTAGDSSTLAPDSTDWTSGDQGKVMCAAGSAGSSSLLTNTLDVGYVSVFLIGSLPNCSAALCTVHSILSGMSKYDDGVTFPESWHGKMPDDHVLVDVTSATLSCGFNHFLASNTTPFYPVCKSLFCPCSAIFDNDTLGEACAVTGADGHTTAGDAEVSL